MNENIQHECKLLPVSQLTSNAPYQRELNMRFIELKLKTFDILKVQVLIVSCRDGKYYIVDGQHTATICSRHYAPEEAYVWCHVFYGLTYEQEAAMFSEQRNERPISVYDKFHALCESKDETAMLLDNIIRSYGFRFSSHAKDHIFGSPRMIQNVYKSFGEEVLCKTLDLLNTLWEGKKEYLKSNFVFSLAKVIHTYGDQFDQNVAENLQQVPFNKMVAMADSLGKRNFAYAIVKLYNSYSKKNLDIELVV